MEEIKDKKFYFFFNENTFCHFCFKEVGLECQKCHKTILDDYFDLEKGRYHLKCLECINCQNLISGPVCEMPDGLYHPDCYMKINFKLCDLCEDYIMDTKHIEFKDYVSKPPILFLLVFACSMFSRFTGGQRVERFLFEEQKKIPGYSTYLRDRRASKSIRE